MAKLHVLCKQERHEGVRSVDDRFCSHALLEAHHIGTGIELEPYQIFADDYNGHSGQPKASSGFKEDHSVLLHVYWLKMGAVVQIAYQYLALELFWFWVHFASFQGYFVVIGIERGRFLWQRRNHCLPLLQTADPHSLLIEFKRFLKGELALLVIDHINCAIIHNLIQIEGNSSKSSLIGQVNNLIILWHIEVVPDEVL